MSVGHIRIGGKVEILYSEKFTLDGHKDEKFQAKDSESRDQRGQKVGEGLPITLRGSSTRIKDRVKTGIAGRWGVHAGATA